MLYWRVYVFGWGEGAEEEGWGKGLGVLCWGGGGGSGAGVDVLFCVFLWLIILDLLQYKLQRIKLTT